jgi:hypothetical protein
MDAPVMKDRTLALDKQALETWAFMRPLAAQAYRARPMKITREG